MEFFEPRRRNIFDEDRFFQPSWFTPSSFGRQFLHDDYYDPLYGRVTKKQAPRQQSCSCQNCRREQFLQKKYYDLHQRMDPFPTIRRSSFPDADSSGDESSDSMESQRANSNNKIDKSSTTAIENENEINGAISTENTQTHKEESMDSEIENLENLNVNEVERTLESNTTDNETAEENTPDKKESLRKMLLIQKIQNEVEKIKLEVDRFVGNVNKEYLYLEEILTKCLIQLDEILANGEDEIRVARKYVINEVNESIKTLENKISANEENDEQ